MNNSLFGPNFHYSMNDRQALVRSLTQTESPTLSLDADVARLILPKLSGVRSQANHAFEVIRRLNLGEKWLFLRCMFSNKFPSGGNQASPVEMVRAVLRELESSGCLVNWSELERTFSPIAYEPIRAIGVITADRPLMLKRALESYLRNCTLNGRTDVTFFVADDSKDSSNASANRTNIDELSSRFSMEIRHITSEDVEGMIDRCCKNGIAREDARFFLKPSEPYKSYGANRNRLLLATAGLKVLFVDDDTICNQRRLASSSRDRLGCYGLRKLPFQLGTLTSTTFEDRYLESCEKSVLEPHEKILGMSAQDIASKFFSSEQLLGVIPPALIRDCVEASGRVVYSFNGLHGDAGSQASDLDSFISAMRLRQFERARKIWHEPSRMIVKYSPSLQVQPEGPSMFGFVGYDNSKARLPFFPLLRNEDGLFAVLNRLLDPGIRHAYIPEMLEHQPESVREIPRLINTREKDLSLSGYVCIEHHRLFSATSEIPSTGLGTESFGQLMLEQMQSGVANLKRGWLERSQQECTHIEQDLRSCHKQALRHNRQLGGYLKEAIAKYVAFNCKEKIFAAPELVEELGGREAERVQQNLLERYFRALGSWGAMFDEFRATPLGGDNVA